MTAALDALTHLDVGAPLPGDNVLLAVFTKHSRDDWAAVDVQLDRHSANLCVVCGKPGEGPECASCTAEWDAKIARSVDV